ncbi:MAG: peptidoglycan DD-metalloendopeptidase family protein [Chitinophagaceae bacterium]|jgi:septal ring factor EnvC (AmiA/AmiB activator)|nr:peptidoglycan DD-metalloendopeptidase family protein [Chitinophagaceae bacterium]MCA6467035.1 peptidoglycan DD-metalloendopeptidase family protein [Chitinophagaceae bacterium]MCA6478060.1 peptidoglycan DD-metalloendopeptidase family protein [Chitinophagaceae bacterium]MCA6479299.1 peptidoglycan DD-metalloendopeptidase family protein [Chitinophagaceae bacterium]MCA6486070.1 peptidoglycan DD-metalloendopeptidase family protein [Chitinophagaceae bacterium]
MPFFQPRFLLVCLFCLLAVGLSAQNSREELQKREQELQKELADLNRLYNETQNNKKLSLKQLAIIKSKINRREELVNSINKQIRQLDETIYLKERDVYRLRRELDTLRQKYAKSLVFAFKHRSNYEYLNFLFSAINFNDAIKRVTYLRSYRRNRETQAVAIAKSEVLLKEKIELLNSSKKERMSTLVVQNEQLKVLQTDKKEQDKVVEQLKGKEKELTAQIRDKEKQRQRVQQAFQAIIRREIDEAKKRETARIKAKEEKAKTQPARPSGGPSANEGVTAMASPYRDRTYTPLESTPEGREMSINFENNRGSLPWPVSSGVVTAHFGIENIPGTKLKRKTDGIEISLPVGSVVKCVADGRISYISEVEGEQVIIIQHGKYFTGYTNLSSVSVNKNQEVKAGTVLGRSGVSIDGEGSLIFMITNEKSTPIDPEIWLKSRK